MSALDQTLVSSADPALNIIIAHVRDRTCDQIKIEFCHFLIDRVPGVNEHEHKKQQTAIKTAT